MFNRTHGFRRAATVTSLAIFALLFASCGGGNDNDQNALHPAGPYANKILDLTRPFFWIAVAVGVGVVGGTIFVALRFRVKPGEERAVKQVHGNTILEMSWTIVPALILLVMAVPTVATVFDLAKRPKGPEVLNITVTARQWWWEYSYQDGTNIETANEMHIPIGVPVALTLVGPPQQSSSCEGPQCYQNGVIHSFWIPELNGKKDVVPGRHQFLKLFADKPGNYSGQCAEYCGLSHADMRARVVAQTPEDFRTWQQQQLEARPEDFYKRGVMDAQWGQYACTTCHSFVPTKPGAVGPNLTHLADRQRFAGYIYDTNYENLWQWVWNAPSRKPMGNLAQHMPAFNELGMTQDQAKDIACFLLENTASTPKPQPECESR
jgi:cytochrome c oxidase subunit 2